jgi:hypothetical protein
MTAMDREAIEHRLDPGHGVGGECGFATQQDLL